jgi:hypothetical protein
MAFFKMTPRSRRPAGARRALPTLLGVEELETRNLMSFTLGPILSSGSFPLGITAADLTGNGKQDVVFTNWHQGVSVMLGNGDGTFQAAQLTSLESYNGRVAVADVNGDGKPDLVVTTFNNGSSAGQVAVLLGNGNGTFQAPSYFNVGHNPLGVAIADVNGDGKPDLVVANYFSNTISVLLGNGNGTFGAAQNFATANGPVEVKVADLNGDGKLDIATNDKGSSQITVLYGNGDGTFEAAQNLGLGGTHTDALVVADLNGDGKFDLTTDLYGSGKVSVLLGNGNGTFQSPQLISPGATPVSIFAGDFNGDGNMDLATPNSNNTVSVLLSNGNGTFQSPQLYPGTHGLGTTADFNGDGLTDIAVADYSNNTITILLNSATAQYQVKAPGSTTAGQVFKLTVTAETASQQTDTHYIGTVHLTSSDPNAFLPADYTFTAADKGVHTFSGLALEKAGSETITATDTESSAVTFTAKVKVQAAEATHFLIKAPTSVSAGVPFNVTITALDAYGNVAVGYIGTVHFTSTDSAAVLPSDYAFQSTDKGKHTFSVTLNTAGSETITVADTTHSTVSGQVTVTVNNGAAARSARGSADSPWRALEAYFAGEAFEMQSWLLLGQPKRPDGSD